MTAPYLPEGSEAGATRLVFDIEAYTRRALASVDGNVSLSGGLAGIALFYAKLQARFPDAVFAETLARIQERIYARCESGTLRDLRLFTGLTGTAFAIEHVAAMQAAPCAELEEINDDLDRVLDGVLHAPWQGHYDLVGGLVGLGIYALARHRGTARQRLFSKVHAQLKALAIRTPEGLAWRTAPRFFGYESRQRDDVDGNFNLGLAHGNPGVIALFAEAVAGGIGVAGLEQDLHAATRWLLVQDAPGGTTRFGYVAGDATPSRLAWCYGDLTAALAVIRSGQVLGDDAFVQAGSAIACAAVRRTPAAAQVTDHGLCHGFAGIGLVCSALHRDLALPAMRTAAQTWYGYTLDAGAASFDRLATLRDDGSRALEPGALCGMAGIGLALLDAMQSTPDGWSRWLLV